MIKPSIGRVVLVYSPGTTQFCPALICYVHNDTLINVGGFDPNGDPFKFTSLELKQNNEGDVHPGPEAESGPFACWMPYQRAVAK